MCEATVFLEENGEQKLVMKDVALITPAPGGLELTDLFGERHIVAGRIKEIQLVQHRIVLESEK